jgi:uracil-DNA glycosylase
MDVKKKTFTLQYLEKTPYEGFVWGQNLGIILYLAEAPPRNKLPDGTYPFFYRETKYDGRRLRAKLFQWLNRYAHVDIDALDSFGSYNMCFSDVLKCRIRKRRSLKQVMQNCAELLRDEINLFHPTLIVTLGENAYTGLEITLNESASSRKEWRRRIGKSHLLCGYETVPLYFPCGRNDKRVQRSHFSRINDVARESSR